MDHSNHTEHSHDTDNSAESEHDHHAHHQTMATDFRQRFWVALALSLPVLALSPSLQDWFGFSLTLPAGSWIAFGLAAVVYSYGGWPFLAGAKQELEKRQPGMMTLVAIGISAAFGYSLAVQLGLAGEPLLWELVTLVDVMLLGHWIEMRATMGASNALRELSKLLPSEANRITQDGSTEMVPISDLQIGDVVLVRPGEKVPVDGEIIKGETDIDLSAVTGESKLATKKVGDEVIAGSVNGSGSIRVEIEKVGEDTYLSQVMKLVADAQAQKSQTQKLADRAAANLAYVAVAAGLLTLAGWTFFSGQLFSYALQRTIAVIVIACPHALGLAIPLVSSISTSLAAKSGLLIRNRTAFEQSGDISAIIFDKTGTLTKGEFVIDDYCLLSENESKEEVLRLAASLESDSEHPLGKAIAATTEASYSVEGFRALPGRGIEGVVDGRKLRVVSPGFLTDNNITIPDKEKILQANNDGKTVVYVLEDDRLLGAIILDDVVRESAVSAVKNIKDKGIVPIMLTGDSESVANRVAVAVGIDEVYAEVLPDEKSDIVKKAQETYGLVAMVGDGVNDAPALATADVGMAIGSGTDVAAETADIILVNDDPGDVVRVMDLGRRTYRKMVQNLWWAAGYNIVALPLAAGVMVWAGIVLSPAVGAALMAASTVVVAVNATLLRREAV
ncbi:MAG: copper-translocating P-type ATPase [Candidatus Paceibacterota bacterium]